MSSEHDSLHHVAINAADINSSIAWYTSSFNCSVKSKSETHAILSFENLDLVLVLPSQETAHIAFVRDDADTLGELRQQKDGTKSVFVADPTGNPIEIVCQQTVAT